MPLPLILVSPNEQVRTEEIDILLSVHNVSLEHPDVLFLSEKLGIESIKKVCEHLSWKPALARKRVVVINPADSLTVDAQNGLLKILEEPSENALIILAVEKEDSLLSTITSRCEIRVISNLTISENEDTSYINELLLKSSPERLEAVEKIEDRKKLLKDLISFYHQKLATDASSALEVKKLLAAERWIKQNVAPKAVTDYIMLILPEVSN